MVIDYQKRKNHDLFKNFELEELTNFSNIQNYIPIYKRFFSLNETNYNTINLNHKWFISNILESDNQEDDDYNIFNCRLKNIDTSKVVTSEVFFKMAPLLDPFKYLVGKYNVDDPKLYKLPVYNSTIDDIHPKILDVNNSAYTDSFFCFVSSQLIHSNNFFHGVDFYGSFLAIKNNFALNVYDDIDYLAQSDFFNKNKNVLFSVDDYEEDPDRSPEKKLKPIKIFNDDKDENVLFESMAIDNTAFEDIFDTNITTLDNLKDLSLELEDINMDMDVQTNINMNFDKDTTTTLKSSTTCSSRTSHTNSKDSIESKYSEEEEECAEDDENNSGSSSGSKVGGEEGEEEDDEEEEEEVVDAIIPKFPVHVICMENCENTFDDLILNNELTHDEWMSALMQIIMILLTYQNTFSFTHNDLHTNNVMYSTTKKKHIFYCYKKIYYKVPTFGRIFKIIDFGRSIYKYKGKIFCSDSFQQGGDAVTQYNTEPYFNEKKKRLDPNFSFDLCRLACSIFDYVVDDLDKIKDLESCSPIVKLIVEWCLDDKGVNLLYKNNGADRYPEFKLYKMIARCVHNHTPHAQLERDEFQKFIYLPTGKMDNFINIDEMPCYQ